jgi:hypothetical protein
MARSTKRFSLVLFVVIKWNMPSRSQIITASPEIGVVLVQLMANQDGVESEPIPLVLGATFILVSVEFSKLD